MNYMQMQVAKTQESLAVEHRPVSTQRHLQAHWEEMFKNKKKEEMIMVLYSFTCSDQQKRSPVTRSACLDTITSTSYKHTHTHTQRHKTEQEQSARHTSPQQHSFFWLLGALLYTATISLPPLHRRLAPLLTAPRIQTQCFEAPAWTSLDR
jgi:hypothetical protein